MEWVKILVIIFEMENPLRQFNDSIGVFFQHIMTI